MCRGNISDRAVAKDLRASLEMELCAAFTVTWRINSNKATPVPTATPVPEFNIHNGLTPVTSVPTSIAINKC